MDDLISRQAAIDAILHNQEVYSNNFGDDPIDKYTIAIIDNDAQTIAQFPSAQQWTPVSERLPEKSARYIVTNKRCGAYEVGWNAFYKGQNEGWIWDKGVVAWMPLPEPYKGEAKC